MLASLNPARLARSAIAANRWQFVWRCLATQKIHSRYTETHHGDVNRVVQDKAPAIAYAVAVVVGVTMTPVPSVALPACAGPVEAGNVRVLRVERNGDLVLEDGRAIRLEGLRLPQGDRDRAPAFFAEQAATALSEIATGRLVTLSVFFPKEDRYGRLRAQVFMPDEKGETWLQIAMLSKGLARVAMSPDRHECVHELYAAEAQARGQHEGIWRSQAYAVRKPADLADAYGSFQIVEGKVLSSGMSNGRAYLDFGRNWRHDFKVTVSPDDLKRFRDAGVDPLSYEGFTIRVRGYVERMGGPEIEVASPQAIEVVALP